MKDVELSLQDWKNSLCMSVDAGSLYVRNPTAHKWKAPWRSLLIREVVFWRLHDILTQSFLLHNRGHALGARILLRSGWETIALLIYLNQMTEQVIAGELDFHVFSRRTEQFLLGSKDDSTEINALNILTVLQKCDKRYPNMSKMYNWLSESAHPNFAGMLLGYSNSDGESCGLTVFTNRMSDIYADSYLSSIKGCIAVFEAEYEIWDLMLEDLEEWMENNDAKITASQQ